MASEPSPRPPTTRPPFEEKESDRSLVGVYQVQFLFEQDFRVNKELFMHATRGPKLNVRLHGESRTSWKIVAFGFPPPIINFPDCLP